MTIRYVCIDFWNTLYSSNNGDARARQRSELVIAEMKRMDFPIEAALLEAATKATWDYFNDVWEREHRTVSTRELVEFYFGHMNFRADDDAVRRVQTEFEEGILQYPPRLLPGVKEALDVLAGRYPLALISDTAFSPGRVLKKLMEQSGIAQYFTAYSFSDETGVSKPHPKAFETALAILQARPAESVHIGDIERTDVSGAKNYNMKAILYTGDEAHWMPDYKPGVTCADAREQHWDAIPDIVRGL